MKIFVLYFVIFAVMTGCLKEEETPELFIEDRVGILTKESRDKIGEIHKTLLNPLKIHFKVTILSESPSDLDETAAYLFEEYALKNQAAGKRGLLLLVDPVSQQVRMEIGYDLEPIYPEGFIQTIEDVKMVPFFQAGKVGAGIESTGEYLISSGRDGIMEAEFRSMLEYQAPSGSPGATVAENPTPIEESPPEIRTAFTTEDFGPQPSPRLALEKYVDVLQKKIKDPSLKLYSPKTREFLEGKPISDGKQDHELNRLEKIITGGRTNWGGDKAVIRFSKGESISPPYFFLKGEAGWMLDFYSMAKLIGFDFKNQWFFRNVDHEYMFAFQDIHFEKGEVEQPGNK